MCKKGRRQEMVQVGHGDGEFSTKCTDPLADFLLGQLPTHRHRVIGTPPATFRLSGTSGTWPSMSLGVPNCAATQRNVEH